VTDVVVVDTDNDDVDERSEMDDLLAAAGVGDDEGWDDRGKDDGVATPFIPFI